jgi:8-oxo-dGTP diphosphatase
MVGMVVIGTSGIIPSIQRSSQESSHPSKRDGALPASTDRSGDQRHRRDRRLPITAIDKIAWIRLEHGRVLSTRSRGKDVYYLPGGKREPGETDVQTLVREIEEEVSVAIVPASALHVGTFEAQAHGHPAGTMVRMTCYAADYQGTLAPSNEVEELIWLGYGDRDRVSPVDQVIFDHLHRTGRLS